VTSVVHPEAPKLPHPRGIIIFSTEIERCRLARARRRGRRDQAQREARARTNVARRRGAHRALRGRHADRVARFLHWSVEPVSRLLLRRFGATRRHRISSRVFITTIAVGVSVSAQQRSPPPTLL
jgi:hypothetical protein